MCVGGAAEVREGNSRSNEGAQRSCFLCLADKAFVIDAASLRVVRRGERG